MKNIILLISALIILTSSFSQSVELFHDGESLENGQEVVMIGSNDLFDMAIELSVSNTSFNEVEITCNRYILDTITDSDLYMCWANCTVLPTGGTVTLEPGETTDVFSAHINPNGHFGIERNLYTFFNANNPSDSISFIATFVTTSFIVNNEENEPIFFQNIELWGVPGQSIIFDGSIIQNISETAINMLVSQSVIEQVEGSQVSFEWGEILYEMEDLSETILIAANSEGNYFTAYYTAGNSLGISEVNYTFFEENNEENAQAFSLIFNTTSVGLNNPLMIQSAAWPNPSTGKVNILIDSKGSSNTKILIYNSLGQIVFENPIAHTKDQLTIYLTEGQYYYQFQSESFKSKAQKLIIQP